MTADLAAIEAARALRRDRWSAGADPGRAGGAATEEPVINPADPGDTVGTVAADRARPMSTAPSPRARSLVRPRRRSARRPAPRRRSLRGPRPELFALLAREAGKTPPMPWPNCARPSISCATTPPARRSLPHPRAGVFACISPWNFPLAIFTGQIAAALARATRVLAKPAEADAAHRRAARRCCTRRACPRTALQLLPATARDRRGADLRSRIDGVAFTGSTATAQAIHRAMAATSPPTPR
jgi:RHH-type proline utilization regulon transcriptional repressor/proline dehydrogenase/delta 1-pyrroline-5-carboxylate dehydrogenase